MRILQAPPVKMSEMFYPIKINKMPISQSIIGDLLQSGRTFHITIAPKTHIKPHPEAQSTIRHLKDKYPDIAAKSSNQDSFLGNLMKALRKQYGKGISNEQFAKKVIRMFKEEEPLRTQIDYLSDVINA